MERREEEEGGRDRVLFVCLQGSNTLRSSRLWVPSLVNVLAFRHFIDCLLFSRLAGWVSII